MLPIDPDAQEALQARFHDGDVAAFSALVAPHTDTIYTLCLRISGNATEADDLAQDAMLRAMSRHRSYDPTRSFRPWLLTVTTNLCRDRLRTVWWRRVLPFSKPHYTPTPGPELAARATQRDALVRDALARLPLRYREALALYYFDDLTYEEMASITGASVPALKQRVRRGRVMLREMVSELYPGLDPET